MSCNFEKDLCAWNIRSLSGLKWIRTSQMNISTSNPLRGPGRDHSNNSAEGTCTLQFYSHASRFFFVFLFQVI